MKSKIITIYLFLINFLFAINSFSELIRVGKISQLNEKQQSGLFCDVIQGIWFGLNGKITFECVSSDKKKQNDSVVPKSGNSENAKSQTNTDFYDGILSFQSLKNDLQNIRLDIWNKKNPGKIVKCLVQKNASELKMWINREDKTFSSNNWNEHLFDNLLIRPLDFFMPFLFQNSNKYIGSSFSRGRPVHKWQFQNQSTNFDSIVISIDSFWKIILSIDYFSQKSEIPVRSMYVSSLKKTDNKWMFQEIIFSNESKLVKLKTISVDWSFKLESTYFTTEGLFKKNQIF